MQFSVYVQQLKKVSADTEAFFVGNEWKEVSRTLSIVLLYFGWTSVIFFAEEGDSGIYQEDSDSCVEDLYR